MNWFKPKDLLDQTFLVGIVLKGLDGVVEIVGGLLLLVMTPSTINRLVAAITQHELSEDPRDFIDTNLIHAAHGLTGSSLLFGSGSLLSHGLVKLVLCLGTQTSCGRQLSGVPLYIQQTIRIYSRHEQTSG